MPIQTTTPRNGYNHAETDDYGVQLLWNDEREEMGTHVIFAGSTLRNLLERGQVHMASLLRDAVHSGGNITRLDIAKDITGQAVNLEKIYQHFKTHGSGGSAEKVHRHDDISGGFTIYIGSRTSERFVRLYDKAKESNLPGELWTRFEIETKGMVARSLAERLCSSVEWGFTFDGIVTRMANQRGQAEWGKLFSMDSIPIGLPKIERHSDRERWIDQQVIGAVAKHYIDNPTSESVARLISTLILIDRQRKE